MTTQNKKNIPAKYDFTNPDFLEALRAETAGEEPKSTITKDELEMRMYANKCIAAYYKALLEEM